jgi:radical SAM-linked protein
VGTESRAEYLDLELYGELGAEHVAERVRARLPEGFRLLSCDRLRGSEDALNRSIRGIEYRVELPEGAPDASERIARFAALPAASVLREREGKRSIQIDLKAAVHGLAATGPRELRFTLRAGEMEAVARPAELLAALFGAEWTKPGVARLVRENAVFGVPSVS